MAISGLSRVRTDLFPMLVVASLAPHPVQTDRKFTGHGYLGDAPFPSHGQVEKLAAPVGVTAHCDLRRFHQQSTQMAGKQPLWLSTIMRYYIQPAARRAGITKKVG
jgi:hypothetical protein